VLRRPTGEERPTGITGALAALPTAAVAPPARVVELPAATASRQLGAPAPRAVARDGSPGTSWSARTGPSRGRQAPRPDPSEQPGSSSGAGGRQPAEETLQLSPEGLERLQAELHELRTIRRPEVVRRVATAREHGDLKENAEYHAAREELGFLDGRANAIAARLRSAVVVDVPDPGARAGIGSTLVVVCDGEEQTLRLVGSSEADVATGRISVVSPVGRALMGASEGDEVAVATPAGQVAYRVLSIT
jgi:transcription elongation factor GreA